MARKINPGTIETRNDIPHYSGDWPVLVTDFGTFVIRDDRNAADDRDVASLLPVGDFVINGKTYTGITSIHLTRQTHGGTEYVHASSLFYGDLTDAARKALVEVAGPVFDAYRPLDRQTKIERVEGYVLSRAVSLVTNEIPRKVRDALTSERMSDRDPDGLSWKTEQRLTLAAYDEALSALTAERNAYAEQIGRQADLDNL